MVLDEEGVIENSMMPPEKNEKVGKWSMRQGVEVVRYGQGGIDLLSFNHRTEALDKCSLPPPPLLILVGLFPHLSDLGEPARQSSPVCRLGLSPSPSPWPVFALIFDFRQTKFIAFLGLAPLHQCLAR